MSSPAENDLPLLRFRESGADKRFNHVMVLMGKIVGVDTDVVSLHQGRERVTQIYLEDLATVLGGPDMAMGIMLDAGQHGDLVKIGLTHERVTYENPQQLERFRNAAQGG